MNHDDEQMIRQRLHGELGSLEIPPAPVIAVTRRGKAIRARRRALGGALAAVVAAALLAARFIGAPGPAPGAVTVNAPNPRAPGGVFASGTADGKPWRLALRNIAADPGTRWCQPAVMFNGRDGDVLFTAGPGVASFGNPAFFPHIPGFRGVGAVFTQVGPEVTRLTATFPGGRRLAVRPVWVHMCGQRFHLAGFAFALRDAGTSTLATYSSAGFDQSLGIDFGIAALHINEGIWVDWDMSWADLAASRSAATIGTGTVNGAAWRVKTALGLSGQCYTVTARAGSTSGRARQCVPVAAPPSAIDVEPVPFPDSIGGLTGYAGLVNPRTTKVVVGLTEGTIPPLKPVNKAGRAYLAFAVPPGCQVTRLRLFDSSGHMFASAAVPGGMILWPPRGAGKASQRAIPGTPVPATP